MLPWISHMEAHRGPPHVQNAISTPVSCKLSSLPTVSAPLSGPDTRPDELKARPRHPNREGARRGRSCVRHMTGFARILPASRTTCMACPRQLSTIGVKGRKIAAFSVSVSHSS